MQPEYPYELEPHELAAWARVWGRWRNNANILMLLGCDRRTAEDVAATWPPASDDLLNDLDPRMSPGPAGAGGTHYRYDDHGVIIALER
jgi:hypothetical protein